MGWVTKNGKRFYIDDNRQSGNRKSSNNNRQSNNRQNNPPNYRPNKLFTVVIGGVVLFTLSKMGLGWIHDTYEKFIEKPQEVEEEVQEAERPTHNTESSVNNTTDIDIDAEDVQEILEKIDEALNDNNITLEVDDILIVDYEEVKDEQSYTNKIVDKLNKYTTFAIVVNQTLNNDEALEILNSIKVIASETVKNTSYSKISVSSISNVPENNNLVIAVTYIE